MKLLYTNDLHIDTIIPTKQYTQDTKGSVSTFIKSHFKEILDTDEKPALILGGDISDSYNLSLEFLKQISVVVDHLFLVFGNHDYYITDLEYDKKFDSSTLKIETLKRELALLGNVTVLEQFKVYDYKGVKICGDTYWYSINTYKEQVAFRNLNDSICIHDFDINFANLNGIADYNELEEDVDIIVTHVPTIYTNSNHKYGGHECFYTPIDSIKSPLYLFGHVHEENTYERAGTQFITNKFNTRNNIKFLEINPKK